MIKKPVSKVFWSYTHDTNEYLNNEIKNIRNYVAEEIRQLYGKDINIIIDSREVRTGQNLESRIRQLITQSSCMVAFLSPTYFMSDWCKKEYQWFIEQENLLGRNDLIMPILSIKLQEKSRYDKNTEQWKNDLLGRSYIDISEIISIREGGKRSLNDRLKKLSLDIFELVTDVHVPKIPDDEFEDYESAVKAPSKSDKNYEQNILDIWNNMSETQKKIMRKVYNCSSKSVSIDSLIGMIKSKYGKNMVSNGEELYYRVKVIMYMGISRIRTVGATETIVSFDKDALSVLERNRKVY